MIGARGRIAVALVALAALGSAIVSCGGGDESPSAPVPPAEETMEDDEPIDPTGEGNEPLSRLIVAVYYPAGDGNGLTGEAHEIFDTREPGDRAKQIVADLISGPTQEGALAAIPAGTRLRQVYITDDGTAWIDFSSDLQKGLGGGSAQEMLVVYSIVNSIALNVPEIQRVGILIDGAAAATLNGHLDTRRPFVPDRSLILDSATDVPAEAVPNRGTGEGDSADVGPV